MNRPRTASGSAAAEGPKLEWREGLLWCIALGPVLMWIAAFWYARLHPEPFISLTKEDGWVENSQVVLFLLSAVLAAKNANMLDRLAYRPWALVYRLATFGLIWISGEEIDWGQRIFGWQTPSWFASHNMQGELNLHNLAGLAWFINKSIYAGVLGSVLLIWICSSRLKRRDLQTYLWLPPSSADPCAAVLPHWAVEFGGAVDDRLVSARAVAVRHPRPPRGSRAGAGLGRGGLLQPRVLAFASAIISLAEDAGGTQIGLSTTVDHDGLKRQ